MSFKDLKIFNKFMIVSTFIIAVSIALTAAIALIEIHGDLLRKANEAQESRLKTFWELLKTKGPISRSRAISSWPDPMS